jgi:hypothetical protein
MRSLCGCVCRSVRHAFVLSLFLLCSTAAVSQELPRVFLDTTYARPAANTITVNAGQDFQAALTNAQPGDTIVLQAGATFTGNFTLPNKSGTSWIYIQTSAYSSLPAPGTRVSPSQAGLMPKIVTNNASPAISTAASAHNYRFVGIEITSSAPQTYNLVSLEAPSQTSTSVVPTDITFDRCYLHGTSTTTLRRAIALNSARTAVVDSYVSECHEVGADAQALAGWNGPGPFKIVNDFLEGSTENVIFGGTDPSIPNLIPADIEVRHNYLYKPLSWNANDPSYGGIHWAVKNLFELKNAMRVLAEGNVMENNWVDAQAGMGVLFTVRNQDGGCAWCAVQDVTFQKNIVKNTPGGVNISGTDDNFKSAETARIAVLNNVIYGITGRTFQLLNINSPDPATAGGIIGLTIEHNTARAGSHLATLGDSTNADDKHQSPIFRNNLFEHGTYGIFGSGMGEGTASLNAYTTNYTFAANVIAGAPAASYPSETCGTSTCFPASLDNIGFVDWRNNDYHLASTSPYKNAGTDGKDLGADMSAVDTATNGTISGVMSGGGGSSQQPFTGTPFAVPGSFEAENFDLGGEGVAYHDNVAGNAGGQYRTTEDVDIVAATGNANGYTVNNFETGEWLEYTINAASAGTYSFDLHVSSEFSNSAYHLEIDGVNVTGTVNVPNTGWWGTFNWIEHAGISLSAGQHVLRVYAENQYFNFDAVRVTAQAPYSGSPLAAPGTIQAENFDRGGEGVAYHDNVAGNAGGQYRTSEDVDIIAAPCNATGYVVNNFETGEWLEYTFTVATAGSYSIQLNASSEFTNSAFHLEVDGVNVSGTVTVPSTGWWGTFAWVGPSGISLSAGQHTLRVVSDTQYFNLDAVRITQP